MILYENCRSPLTGTRSVFHTVSRSFGGELITVEARLVVHSQARPGSSAVALQRADSTISAFTRAHWVRALAVRELSGKKGLLRPAFEVLWARIAVDQAVAMKQVDPTPAPSLTRGRS